MQDKKQNVYVSPTSSEAADQRKQQNIYLFPIPSEASDQLSSSSQQQNQQIKDILLDTQYTKINPKKKPQVPIFLNIVTWNMRNPLLSEPINQKKIKEIRDKMHYFWTHLQKTLHYPPNVIFFQEVPVFEDPKAYEHLFKEKRMWNEDRVLTYQYLIQESMPLPDASRASNPLCKKNLLAIGILKQDFKFENKASFIPQPTTVRSSSPVLYRSRNPSSEQRQQQRQTRPLCFSDIFYCRITSVRRPDQQIDLFNCHLRKGVTNVQLYRREVESRFDSIFSNLPEYPRRFVIGGDFNNFFTETTQRSRKRYNFNLVQRSSLEKTVAFMSTGSPDGFILSNEGFVQPKTLAEVSKTFKVPFSISDHPILKLSLKAT